MYQLVNFILVLLAAIAVVYFLMLLINLWLAGHYTRQFVKDVEGMKDTPEAIRNWLRRIAPLIAERRLNRVLLRSKQSMAAVGVEEEAYRFYRIAEIEPHFLGSMWNFLMAVSYLDFTRGNKARAALREPNFAEEVVMDCAIISKEYKVGYSRYPGQPG